MTTTSTPSGGRLRKVGGTSDSNNWHLLYNAVPKAPPYVVDADITLSDAGGVTGILSTVAIFLTERAFMRSTAWNEGWSSTKRHSEPIWCFHASPAMLARLASDQVMDLDAPSVLTQAAHADLSDAIQMLQVVALSCRPPLGPARPGLRSLRCVRGLGLEVAVDVGLRPVATHGTPSGQLLSPARR